MATVLNAKYELKNYFSIGIINKYSDNFGRVLKQLRLGVSLKNNRDDYQSFLIIEMLYCAGSNFKTNYFYF